MPSDQSIQPGLPGRGGGFLYPPRGEPQPAARQKETKSLLTIDPGADLGWSIWVDGSLLRCGLGDDWKSWRPGLAVIEWPVIYPRSPVPPNDILKLARCAGEAGGCLKDRGVSVQYVEPAQWKGQTPKDVHNKRTKAKIAKLSQREQDCVFRACKAVAPSAQHNILDAVGLGLWVLKL